ncbi:hypothetical protein [Thiohalocapsa halophila]|uniref:hypothetical protein n=1 Tax=Thiohalocapsa halophila TaxID=69359 RepID=UPI001905F632|nr:hypothetical protein [Thiohalocapsa halophila]
MHKRGLLAATAAVLLSYAITGDSLGQQAARQANGGYPIAGTQPSARPAGAPVVREVRKPEGWYTKALTGISQPYPASLGFLEDQGNWYTPFNRPGMVGRYDIRGWHRPSAADARTPQ